MGRLTRSDWAVVLVSAPVVILAIAWVAVLALSAGVDHPIWHARPQNLAEAAAFRDGAAVVRRVRGGENPNAPGDVRQDFISPAPLTLTPIEAAAVEGRPEIVQLLLDLGAMPDAASWKNAWCLAGAADVRDLLARHRPPAAATGCGEDPANR
jgi:hypothetical protein